jgi:crossover junction endodeoxyribonuclease RuvC
MQALFSPSTARGAVWHDDGVGVTPRQFEVLRRRLTAPRRTPVPAASTPGPDRHPESRQAVILGIDPSLRGTGYGVIESSRSGVRAVAQGVVVCPAGWERSRCLARIGVEIREIVRRHAPTACVVEGLFYAQNYKTALIMGEARGASLAAVAEAGVAVYEISPRKVKQAIVGYGAAQKSAVARMVQRMLGLAEAPAADAADALALALAYAQEQGRYSLSTPKRI